MQKLKMAYNYCLKESHLDECLNTICIEKECSKNRLLCCLCLEDHEGHKLTALKKFLVEYKQQYQKLKNEEEDEFQQYNLSKTLQELEKEVQNFKQIINGNIENLLKLISEQKTHIASLKPSTQLTKIGSTLENIIYSDQQNSEIAELFSEVEKFQSNDGFSFTIRKPDARLSGLSLRFQKSEQILNDYIQFNQKFYKQIEKYLEKMSYQIKNQFSPDQENTQDNQSEQQQECQQQTHSNGTCTPDQDLKTQKTLENGTKDIEKPQINQ